MFLCFCSVECAMFVMNFIKQRSENMELDAGDEIYKPQAMYLQRASLAYKILNCKPHSWGPVENLTQKFFLSSANKIV